MVKKKSAASKAVRQAEKSVRAVRARAKKLLSRAQLDVREYRRELANLKKQQIVSKRINAAKHQPTRYMLNKIKKFKGVAVGHELAVPVKKMSPHRARLYSEKGMARIIDGFLLRPKTAEKQKLDIHKDHIRVTTELRKGQEEVIPFPTRLEDMHDVLTWLKENEAMINDLKGPTGQLGFQISGFNSRVGLANVRELIAYLQKYDGSEPRFRGNLFNGDSHKLVKEFILIRFKPAKGTNRPQMEPFYGEKRRSKHAKDRKDQRRGEAHRRQMERERKARQRMAEDKDQYEARLAKQRQRDRARANDRREKRMAEKLLGK